MDMSKTKIVKWLFIALLSEAALFSFFLFAAPVHAQVNEPIFTTGENFADKVTAVGTTTVSGNLHYSFVTNESIDGCISTTSPQRRFQYAQWFGSSWTLSGGGGSSSCFDTDKFILASTTGVIRINSASDGYFCTFYGSGGVTLNEENHIKHICVLQTNGGLSYELIETQTEFVVSPLNFQTRFVNAIVSGASSTTVEFDIEYYLKTSEYTPTTRPDIIQVSVLKDGFFSNQQTALEQRFILPLTDGFHFRNIPFDHAFDDGDYIAYINFWNLNTNNFTFSETNIVLNFEISGGAVVNTEIIEITNGENLGETIKYEDCSFTNIYGCIVNAMIYLFVPSSGVFTQFFTIVETVDSKPPFGFYTATIQSLTISTTTDAFTMPTLPFENEIFTPLKNLIGSVLIFGYIFFFTSRAMKIIV